ncbi:peptide chain release factor N(5)-glutamine methyltransferase [Pseudooctadecabacter jejudonensis]|uniref:Release factor glutamine methyltransferase n=1 Tax=Pseudooctadecabacter jejudonensis TaxID=1391910 RepID=A0A1Y5RJ90_9RHOB|nr:peptide chain release factor N(5)-glutamine methyltransferase [Pseudooctadecabacter jejudonensis]SLN18638.1 Release factor glutamine methyltransferase [Pseudooctadecabacter jejudonensis]
MSEAQRLAWAVDTLQAGGLADPVREARLLWRNVGEDDRFEAAVTRRAARVPMSHVLGYRDFWKHRFTVTSDVLDPRPETETLVEAALEVPFRKVLDLGTGSGAIIISLLAERSEARGVGTDISERGILVAGANAAAIGVVDRLILPLSDWYDDVGGQYDLIVSNPPYIALDEMPDLAPEVSHEPRMALTDEDDGLSCYRIICAGAPSRLVAGGWLMVEIGPTQGEAVAAMMSAAGLVSVEIRPDLDGRHRVVMGQKPL